MVQENNYELSNNIEFITIATLGNALDFGDLSTHIGAEAGVEHHPLVQYLHSGDSGP